MLARALYTLLLHLALPLIGLRLLLRARRQPGMLHHWGERFGRYPGAAARSPRLWIHAVSVGETRATEPLIKALAKAYPGQRIVLTHMTLTGRATRLKLPPEIESLVERRYLPYDYPWAVERFLRHYRPVCGLIMETEIWPNLFAACLRRKVPTLLINARLSERSARGYRRLGPLVRPAFSALGAVAAQTEQDARRLASLCAPTPQVVGNLKFDIDPGPQAIARAAELKALIGARPVVLCASTREGEESRLLEAWIAAQPAALLVLVPRHPERFEAVAELIKARGLVFARRSQGEALTAHTQVLLGDSMGELPSYYGAADIAFVGGSLLPLGGQNLIEACVMGTPVLVGPHTFNFEEITREAIACGAARRVDNATELMAAIQSLLNHAPERDAMARAGRAFAQRHRGATRRVMALVDTLITPGSASPR